jgi:outer membrane protein assembly factor BamB
MIRALVLVGLVGACGGGGTSPDAATFEDVDAGPDIDGGDLPVAPIYAHTATELFTVDPTDGTAALVGPFADGTLFMMDLAVDADGALYAVDGLDLYRVSASTGAATLVRDAGDPGPDPGLFFNGIGFSGGTLYGGTGDGQLYRFDTDTGQVTLVGAYGGGLGTAGDIVQLGGTTYVAVANDVAEEYLAELDLTSGAATVVGDATGLTTIYGLATDGSRILAFLEDGSIHALDPSTGAPTMVRGPGSEAWFGAGSAP